MSEFETLLHRYNEGTCTPEEAALVEAWYARLEMKTAQSLTDAQLAQLFLEPHVLRKRSSFRIWSAAAAIAASVLLFVGAGWFLLQRKAPSPAVTSTTASIQPGSRKATLTLANGQTIVLDGREKGPLAQQAGSAVNVGPGGQLRYDPAKEQAPPAENILHTPKGGMYSVQLPDGSVAWLNAASTLRYPVDFRGMAERVVSLEGEAYFEIAPDHKHPFKVSTDKQTITVLGTHFNVSAYPEEPLARTALLEGRVLVRDSRQASRQLLPGQQASSDESGTRVENVDVQAVIGWKQGDFIFNDDIHVIMRQLSRWYNVDVVYQGDIPGEHFIASISRGKSIDQVLKALSLTHRVHFKIEGRTITVMP